MATRARLKAHTKPPQPSQPSCLIRKLKKSEINKFHNKTISKIFIENGESKAFIGKVVYNKKYTIPYVFNIIYEDGDRENECYEILNDKTIYTILRNPPLKHNAIPKTETENTSSKKPRVETTVQTSTSDVSQESSQMAYNVPQESSQMAYNDTSDFWRSAYGDYLSIIGYNPSDNDFNARWSAIYKGLNKNGVDHMHEIFEKLKDYLTKESKPNTIKNFNIDINFINEIRNMRNEGEQLYSENYLTAYQTLYNKVSSAIILIYVYRAIIYDMLEVQENDPDITEAEMKHSKTFKNRVYLPKLPLATIKILDDYTKKVRPIYNSTEQNSIEQNKYVKVYYKGTSGKTAQRWVNGRLFYIGDEIKESTEALTATNYEEDQEKCFHYGIAFEDGYYEDAAKIEISDIFPVPLDTIPNTGKVNKGKFKNDPRIYVIPFEYTNESNILRIVGAVRNEFIKSGQLSGVRSLLDKNHATQMTMRAFMFLLDAHMNYLNFKKIPPRTSNAAEIAAAAVAESNFKIAMDFSTDRSLNLKEFDFLTDKGERIRYDVSNKITKNIAEYETRKDTHLYITDKNIGNLYNNPEPVLLTTLDYVGFYLFNPVSAMIRNRNNLEFVRNVTQITRNFMNPTITPLNHLNVVPFAYFKKDAEPAKCCCYLCGKPINYNKSSPLYGQLDHIIPVIPAFILGILDSPFNYAPTHAHCNISKNNTIPEGAPISPDFNDDTYQILVDSFGNLLNTTNDLDSFDPSTSGNPHMVESDESDGMGTSGGEFTPRTPGSVSGMKKKSDSSPILEMKKLSLSEPVPVPEIREGPRPRGSPVPAPSRSPAPARSSSVRGSLSYAESAAKVLFAEKTAFLSTSGTLKKPFSAILRFFIVSELLHFFNAILMINGDSRRSSSSSPIRQSGGAPVVDEYIKVFLNKFNSTPSVWMREHRIEFVKSRYNILYLFSVEYYKYTPIVNSNPKSYVQFLIDRISTVLNTIVQFNTLANSLAF